MLGGVIEIAQAGFADRDAQFGDWIADAVGVVLALWVFTVMRWVRIGDDASIRPREGPHPERQGRVRGETTTGVNR